MRTLGKGSTKAAMKILKKQTKKATLQNEYYIAKITCQKM